MPEFIYCFSCNAKVPLEVLNHIVECAYCGEQVNINLIPDETHLV